MGMDISMFICQGGHVIASDIYDGRSSEWFANLRDEGWSAVYDELPIVYGWTSTVPNELKEQYSRDKGYFEHRHILVKYYKEWYTRCNPHKRAGWVTTFEKWRMENQGYIPEDPREYLDKDDVLADMHFIEWEDKYDQATWLYNYLIDNKIDDNAWIVYCFDN